MKCEKVQKQKVDELMMVLIYPTLSFSRVLVDRIQ